MLALDVAGEHDDVRRDLDRVEVVELEVQVGEDADFHCGFRGPEPIRPRIAS